MEDGRFLIEDARMRHFDFPDDVLAQIDRDRFEHLDPAVQRRMEMLWLKAHGETHQRLAQLAGVSRPTSCSARSWAGCGAEPECL